MQIEKGSPLPALRMLAATRFGSRIGSEVSVYTIVNIMIVGAAARGLLSRQGLEVPATFGSALPIIAVVYWTSALVRCKNCGEVGVFGVGIVLYMIGLAALNWVVFVGAFGAI
jgi:hypothetical protein